MISLCLQCCPLDQSEALSLARLICDIEPKKRKNGEFFLVYRKDCPPNLGRVFEHMAREKFGTAVAREARNFDVGWPAGSNMLAGSAFIEMSILRREGICNHEAFLLFEPDCIPLAADWIDQLSQEWDRARANGKEAFGHWHQQFPEDSSCLHMNGNAVFRTDWFDRHPNLIVGSGAQGWDFFFREQIIQISQDSNLIFQNYNRQGITREELEGIQKNGVRPALFHGIKTAHGRVLIRQLLLAPMMS
jgi:hypothetical protein